MNMTISKITVYASLMLGAVVSASIYFMNPDLPSSPSLDHITQPNATAEDHSASAAPLLKNTAHEIHVEVPTNDTPMAIPSANKSVHQEQDEASLADMVMLAKSNQIPLNSHDLDLPLPSSKNVMAEATGEYADQINLHSVIHKAWIGGDPPSEVVPGSHPPTGNNIASEPQGENADEVRQQALIDKAKSAGYLLPEVAPDSHPPTDKNVASESEGENSHEVNQQALIDKAKSMGLLLPQVAIEQ